MISQGRDTLWFRRIPALALSLAAYAALSLCLAHPLSADPAPADTTANSSPARPSGATPPVIALEPIAPIAPDSSVKKDTAAGKAHAPKAAARPAKTAVAAADDDFDEPPTRIPSVTGPVFREVRSIPYPNGAIYLNRGITGSFLGGKHRNLGERQSLYQWQGELGYFYTSYFSGGVAFKITAGEPSDTSQKIRNRYFLQTRFHKSWSNTSFYVGPQLGLDNLNVLNGTPGDTSSILRTPINDTKASLGLDLGAGWKFSRWVGVTLGSTLEYSLVGEEGSDSSNSLNVHINPGFAVDILAFSDSLRDLVPAMYVVVEFQSGFLVLAKNGHRTDRAAILGISLAF